MIVSFSFHIFQVSGLARRVHDSTTLKEAFDQQVVAHRNMGQLPGDRMTLARRVPTRWNSDLECLDAHIYFKSVIKSLIGANSHLEPYSLTPDQWKLAELLDQALVVRVQSLILILTLNSIYSNFA